MEQNTTKEDLLCRACQLKAFGAGQKTCKKHGDAAIAWKCMFCCSEALYQCGGSHFFCEDHHDGYKDQREVEDCKGVNCPLGVPHPPASNNPRMSAFPLGCSICRAENLKSCIGEAQLRDMDEVKIVGDFDLDKHYAQVMKQMKEERKGEVAMNEVYWRSQRVLDAQFREQYQKAKRLSALEYRRKQLINAAPPKPRQLNLG